MRCQHSRAQPYSCTVKVKTIYFKHDSIRPHSSAIFWLNWLLFYFSRKYALYIYAAKSAKKMLSVVNRQTNLAGLWVLAVGDDTYSTSI